DRSRALGRAARSPAPRSRGALRRGRRGRAHLARRQPAGHDHGARDPRRREDRRRAELTGRGAVQGAFRVALVMPLRTQVPTAWVRTLGASCFQYTLARSTLRRLQAMVNALSARAGAGLQAYAAS